MNRRDFIKAAGDSRSRLHSSRGIRRWEIRWRGIFPRRQPGRIFFSSSPTSRHRRRSATGNPWLKTPAEDSIAAKGMRFTKSYCTNPLCSPSRSSLFTSAWRTQTGVNTNDWSAEQLKKFHPEGVKTGKIAPPHHMRGLPDGMPSMGEIFRAVDMRRPTAANGICPYRIRPTERKQIKRPSRDSTFCRWAGR